ncbi:MAG: hypothetical protein ACE5F1_08025 [Planctomycetota bacterium]
MALRFPIFLLLLLGSCLQIQSVPAFCAGTGDCSKLERGQGIEQDDEEEEDDEEEGRSFLFKELVLSGFYSPTGVVGVPPGDTSRDHFEFSQRPPGNYVGADFVSTLTSSSWINKELLPDWLPLTAIDLHPRIIFDRMERNDARDQVKFAPQDFWLRFNPGAADRLSLRLGQFVIPYGVNPVFAPRQRFLLPLEAIDLGLKWDWGLDLKGPLGEYDWEIAATIGSGEAINSPHGLHSSDRTSSILTGRLGTPTYWDFQYGLSFLYGELPVIRSASVLSQVSISRWRAGADFFYKYGTYLMSSAQLTYGQDGFAGDELFNSITMGKLANVFGVRASIDWVVPVLLDLNLAGQFESLRRDINTSGSDDTAWILEAKYSLSTSISLMLDYRHELNRSMGKKDNAIYLTFVYYAM